MSMCNSIWPFFTITDMGKRNIGPEERERRRLYQQAYRAEKSEDQSWRAQERRRTRVFKINVIIFLLVFIALFIFSQVFSSFG
jgi:hypothetical protein